MKRIILTSFFLFIILSYAFSQYVITGSVYDYEDNKPLEYIHIIGSDSTNGTISDIEGRFIIKTINNKGVLIFKGLGFRISSIAFNVTHDSSDIGIIYLKKEPIPLDEVTISTGLITNEKTPVSVSTISAKTIQTQLGDRPLTFAMNTTPGVYSVRTGGGSGDAELIIRGFNQENIGVLLNGIPINGVENGLIYWSNWLGLSNAAAEIQIQKGPGFTNAASNAVGGSVNIVTNSSKIEKSGSLMYQVTSYGNQKFSLALNSGKLNNGWSLSLMGSFLFGPGYVDATYVKGGSYYLSLNKVINPKNSISITALGAPQKHGQRTLKLSNNEHELRGNLFNKDWGSIDGKLNNASENFYHRPFLGINHYLQIDQNKKLTNSVYLILGNGGGKWSESFNYAPTIFEYRTLSDQIDWPAIYENNATHDGTYTLKNGTMVDGYSINVQTHFLASHVQTGFMSNYEQKITEHFTVAAGIHYRYFNSYLREEIIDLLGGNFFIDDFGWAIDGVAGRDQIKTVGDIIKVDNNTIINYANAFAQVLFEDNNWNAFLSVQGNSNWYQRIDRYNYISDNRSELVIKPGFDVRAGIGYKPGIRHNIYMNGAFISKAPFFKYVFGNFNNTVVQHLVNEKIKTFELGYKFENSSLTANTNAFYTDWQNVSMLSNEYVQLEDNEQSRAMINGLTAIHMGVEADISARLSKNLGIGGIISLGNYRWTNDVTAQLFNNENVAVDTVNVFVKDLFAGGTAQQQFGIFANLRVLKTIQIKAEWLYYNNIYANFDPTARNDPNERVQPFEIPSYHLLNMYIGIPFKLFNSTALVQLNAYNLLNNHYIEWGEDGTDHDLSTFRGFWSFGRNFDFKLKINI